MTNITGAILYMYYCSVQVTRLPPCSGSGSIGSDSSVLQIYVSPIFRRHLLVSWEGGGSWDDRILHLGPLSLHPLQLYQPLPGHSGPARVRIKLRQLRMRTEEQISGSFPRGLRHQSHHLYNCRLFPDSGGRCRTLEIKLFSGWRGNWNLWCLPMTIIKKPRIYAFIKIYTLISLILRWFLS